MQQLSQNKPKFNGVYSRNNLSKIKDGAYKINLDQFESVRTHWVALYVTYKCTLIVFDLNIFQKKLENSLVIKML